MLQTKSIKIEDASLEFKADKGTFTGYASVFDVKDSDSDIIVPGAFKSALEARAPKMFFNHNSFGVPIGAWKSLEEDSTGLLVEGQLAAGHSQAEDVKAAMKVGALDGLSIGFRMTKDDFEVSDGIRHIKNIPDLVEISVVTFPANTEARLDVGSLKSDLEEITTIKEFEALLRDEVGASNGLAKALIGKFKQLCHRDDGKHDEIAQRLINDFRLNL